MPTFEAIMRVTHREIWTVEAESLDEAANKFCELSHDIVEDETGGEITDWEIVGAAYEIDPETGLRIKKR